MKLFTSKVRVNERAVEVHRTDGYRRYYDWDAGLSTNKEGRKIITMTSHRPSENFYDRKPGSPSYCKKGPTLSGYITNGWVECEMYEVPVDAILRIDVTDKLEQLPKFTSKPVAQGEVDLFVDNKSTEYKEPEDRLTFTEGTAFEMFEFDDDNKKVALGVEVIFKPGDEFTSEFVAKNIVQVCLNRKPAGELVAVFKTGISKQKDWQRIGARRLDGTYSVKIKSKYARKLVDRESPVSSFVRNKYNR